MLSSNAPFNEFGQSMILRDIEQLYLSLNNAGRGSAGDGGTQDQAVPADQNTGDSGGLPDLSGLATTDYVDAAIAAIPDVSYPISIANGGTAGTSVASALLNLGLSPKNVALASGPVSTSWTVPANIYRILVHCVGGGCGGGGQVVFAGADVFVASTSGGAVTTALRSSYIYTGDGGDSSPYAMVVCDVTPGDAISIVAGAGGAGAVLGSTSVGSRGSDSSVTGTNISISCSPSANSVTVTGSAAHLLLRSYRVGGVFGSHNVRIITSGSTPSLSAGAGGKSPLHPYGSGADGRCVESLSNYFGLDGSPGAVYIYY